jgi:hypothetical protein
MVVDIDWEYRCLVAGSWSVWSFDFFDLVFDSGHYFTESVGPSKDLMRA